MIYERLHYICISTIIINCIKLTHGFTKCNIRMNDTVGDYFQLYIGVAQGAPIYPILFDIVIDVMLKN